MAVRTHKPVKLGVLCYGIDRPTHEFLCRLCSIDQTSVKAYPVTSHTQVALDAPYRYRASRFSDRYIVVGNKGNGHGEPQLFTLSLGLCWALVRESDVVLLFGLQSLPALAATVLARLAGKPVIASCQIMPPAYERGRSLIIRVLKSILLRLSTVIVSQSRATRESLDEVYGLAPTHCIVDAPYEAGGEGFRDLLIQDKSDRDKTRATLGARPEGCVFLYVGSLLVHKGLDVLLDAFAEVSQSRPGSLLVLVGPDGHPPCNRRSHLEAQARKLGIAQSVRFTGRIPYEETARFYKAADVFVLPSHRDMWPKVLIEAALAGLPLVTTDAVGSALDLVRDGKTGFLVSPGSREALAQAMTRVMLAGNRITLGANARRVARLLSDAESELLGFKKALSKALGEEQAECT